jgi:ADP-ribosylglycohydrolase
VTSKDSLEQMFGYDLSASLDELRRTYEFDETCQGTVPAALLAFFESHDYEDAVRRAISLAALDDRLRKVVVQFCQRYKIHV